MFSVKIYTKDCLDFLQGLDNDSIDVFFVDPPFNKGKDMYYKDSLPYNEYLEWCEDWLRIGFQKLKNSGNFFVLIPWDYLPDFAQIMDKFGVRRNFIIWLKRCPVPKKRSLQNYYEVIMFYSKGKDNYFNPFVVKVPFSLLKRAGIVYKAHIPYDVWLDIPPLVGGFMAQKEVIFKKGTQSRVLPFQLPIALLERVIKISSKEGDLISDFFVGLGSTAVACKKLSRKFKGCDINQDYVKIALNRVKNTRVEKKRRRLIDVLSQ